MGLNAKAGHGNSNVKYWGQTYMRTGLHLAPNSVVLLEPPVLRIRKLRTGPRRPVEGHRQEARRRIRHGLPADRRQARSSRTATAACHRSSRDLLTSDKTVAQIFQDDWSFSGAHDFIVQVDAHVVVDGLDGSEGTRSLLPRGQRQPRPQRSAGPRRLRFRVRRRARTAPPGCRAHDRGPGRSHRATRGRPSGCRAG